MININLTGRSALPINSTLSAPALPTYDLTDIGNGERLVSQHGHEIRSCGGKEWRIYDGKQWNQADSRDIQRLAKETAKSIYQEAKSARSHQEESELTKWAIQSGNINRVRAMIEAAASESQVAAMPEHFDGNPFLLNVENGIVDLKTGVLRSHSPNELLSKLVPIDFNPRAQCPRWLKFLDEITLGDPTLVDYLQRVVGYALTGDVSEQCFFILYGTGANGKSVFENIVSSLLGRYAMTTDFSTFLSNEKSGPREDLARLQGARLAIGSEIGIGKHLDETVVKQFTGTDRIAARKLYQGTFEFDPQCKIVLATNHKPRIRGTEEGMWRRVKIIPFDATFREGQKDPNLLEDLRAELRGILAWAVEGCLKWQNLRLSEPQRVWEAIEDYRNQSDDIRCFIKEACREKTGATEASSRLYSHYQSWCEEQGNQAVNQKLFGARLDDLGFPLKKLTKGNVRVGLFIPEPDTMLADHSVQIAS